MVAGSLDYSPTTTVVAATVAGATTPVVCLTGDPAECYFLAKTSVSLPSTSAGPISTSESPDTYALKGHTHPVTPPLTVAESSNSTCNKKNLSRHLACLFVGGCIYLPHFYSPRPLRP